MIYTCSKLITCEPQNPLIENGAIAIKKGTILAVGTGDKVKKRFPSDRVIRLRNAVLLPGLINLHTHLELPPLLKCIQGQTFTDWIINLIRAKKALSKWNYHGAVRININTLIETGTTTVGEICTHGISMAALKQSGIRATVFHEIIDMGSRVKDQDLGISLPKQSESARVRSGLSPHTPYTVSPSVLRAINHLSKKKNIRISMHIAESEEEIKLLQGKKSGLETLYHLAGWNLCRAPHGNSSFEYLNGIGFLSSNLLAVHAVQVTKRDIELIGNSKVSIAHCPRSNKETGVGKMPLKKFLDAGITVGLGTDSLASSPSLNMWDEMRYAHQVHRRSGVSAEDIFRLATINGAKALGLNKVIGTLEPGKRADIIAVPVPHKNTGDLYYDLLRETKFCIMAIVNGKTLTRKDS